MRSFKFIILFITLLMSSNVIQAQAEAIFIILGGLRGVKGNNNTPHKIYPIITELGSADLKLLDNASKAPKKSYDPYIGAAIYAPTALSYKQVNIAQGLSIWNGAKWIQPYSTAPTGSFRGDLQALHVLQQHPANMGVKWNKWDIDLENVDNPNNQKLNGVFFRKIGGEYRVEELHLSDFGLNNMTITEGLEALAYLTLNNCNFKHTDIKLPNLTYLNHRNNRLLVEVKLDCPKLAIATFDDNKELTQVQAKCPKLEYLRCNKNKKLETLDLSNCLELTNLSISENGFTTLDVSRNTKLTSLHCSNNKLNALDLSKNTLLTDVGCLSNKLTSLNVSKNLKLTSLACYDNKLSTLDVSKNTELSFLYCSINSLASLDVSNNRKLIDLSCGANNLTSLNVSKNTVLEALQCQKNQLTELDVTKNHALTELWCYNNKLSVLDISNNAQLATLYCSGNQLASLDLSSQTKLEKLECNSNKLTLLDVSQQTKLESLECDFNKVTSLNLSQHTKLNKLKCYSNSLQKGSIKICNTVLSKASSFNFTFPQNSDVYEVVDCK